jgi:predicted DNA-binding transcriptional regulator AlpA
MTTSRLASSAVASTARAATASRPTPAQPQASARGYRIRDFCAREGVSRSTVWNWARKGVVRMNRLGPAVGVRVAYAEAYADTDELAD